MTVQVNSKELEQAPRRKKERKEKENETNLLYFNNYFRQTNKKDVSMYVYFIPLYNKVRSFNHMLNVKVHNV